MKIAITSDLHGNLPEIPDHDLLLIAGDIFPGRNVRDDISWAGQHLRPWLDKQNTTIVVLGNHDFGYAYHRQEFPNLKWTIIQDELIEINGLKIYGSPWTNFDGAHNVKNWWAYLATEEKLEFIYKNIPYGLDFLITHGPPLGIMDFYNGLNLGSPSLLDEIRIKKPKYHISGHIHEQQGIVKTKDTTFINVSLCNNHNKILINKPIIIEL